MAQTRRGLGLAGLLGCLLGTWACIEHVAGDSTHETAPTGGSPPEPATVLGPDFVSGANPLGDGPDGFGVDPSDGSYVPPSDSAELESSITNAEVLQVSGDRVYALSRFGGLTVVDAADPAALRSLGARRSAGLPVDMYVEDDVVYALFDEWDGYACDPAGQCGWHWTSRLQVLDARDAADIRVVADLEMPGHMDGSRRVGDVLYVVTDQLDGCWGCGADYATTITSFDMADTSQLRQLDQLRLTELGYVDKGNVAINDRRIYISQSRSNDQQQLPSTVHVVDIADPAGALVEGTHFDVAGTIDDSWQLDELDGVLRVISQPRGWGSGEPPLIETFRINSSSDIQRAGSLTIALAKTYELLDTVRFAGARAYAGTSQKRGPLHTFDLSDPTAPRQAIDLALPGPLYHLEPLDGRLITLGRDDGALSVSLFDVQDLAAPALLGQVAFGRDDRRPGVELSQDPATLAIAPELGLIMVPFSAHTPDAATCQDEYQSGIQLIELGDTTLTRRGLAPQVGRARRAFLHRERLFGVDDGAIQTFDIADRGAPVPGPRLHLSRDIAGLRVVGDDVLRLASDGFARPTALDWTPLQSASDPEPAIELDLSALVADDSAACEGTWAWSGQVLVRGNHAYLPRFVNAAGSQPGTSEQRLTIDVVDIADRSAPRAVGRLALPPTVVNEAFTGVLQTDNALLVGRVRYEAPSYPSDKRVGEPSAGATSPAGVSPDVPRYSYDIIDLGDPAAPQIASHFEVPGWIAESGWGWLGGQRISLDRGWGWYGGRGTAELTSGDMVISSHSEYAEQSLHQKYYLDRLDVTDPYQPRWLEPISIPGSVLAYDDEAKRLLTLEYINELEPSDSGVCSRGNYSYFESEQQACRVFRRSISVMILEDDRAIRTDQVFLDRERLTTQIAISGSRIFFTTSDFPTISPFGDSVPPPPGAVITGTVTLQTLERAGDRLIPHSSVELRSGRDDVYDERLFARDDRAFDLAERRMTVVDTHDPAAPAQRVHDLPAWSCAWLDVAGDKAYCAGRQRGVEVIDLGGTP